MQNNNRKIVKCVCHWYYITIKTKCLKCWNIKEWCWKLINLSLYSYNKIKIKIKIIKIKYTRQKNRKYPHLTMKIGFCMTVKIRFYRGFFNDNLTPMNRIDSISRNFLITVCQSVDCQSRRVCRHVRLDYMTIHRVGSRERGKKNGIGTIILLIK